LSTKEEEHDNSIEIETEIGGHSIKIYAMEAEWAVKMIKVLEERLKIEQ